MQILFLALDVDLDRLAGDATHVRELVRNLAALGHSVDLVAEAGGRDLEPVQRLRVVSGCGGGTRRQLARVLKLTRGTRPDAVYERRLTPKVGLAVSRVIGAPLFVEVNGLPDEERAIQEGRAGRPSALRLWARRRILRRARSVVAVSEGIRRRLREVYGVDDSRLRVIPNGVDVDRFHPVDSKVARSELGIDSGSTIVGFAGRLTPWQGVDVLVRAIPMIRREADAMALIVGDGPDRARLESLAASLGVKDHVRFVGAVPYERVPSYIGAFDVAFSVKPPLLPGSPLKVREYLACGRPVVASSGTEYDFHIVAEAGAGLLVDPSDVGAVSAAALSLLADDRLRAEMGRRGRAYAEAHCSWAVTARRVAEVCRT